MVGLLTATQRPAARRVLKFWKAAAFFFRSFSEPGKQTSVSLSLSLSVFGRFDKADRQTVEQLLPSWIVTVVCDIAGTLAASLLTRTR